MKKSRFTDSQIMAILKQHETGVSVADLAREHGCGMAMIYQWRSKYVGMDASPMKRMIEWPGKPAAIRCDNELPAVSMELVAIRDRSGITRLPSNNVMLG